MESQPGKLFIVFVLAAFWNIVGYAQKPAIGFANLNDWNYDISPQLSNNGKYISLQITRKDSAYLLVESTDLKWKRQFAGGTNASFSANSKCLFFNKKDTLITVNLHSHKLDIITGVVSYKTAGDWLAYQLKNGDLTLKSFTNRNSTHIKKLKYYVFSPDGQSLLFYKEHDLLLADLKTLIQKTIWQGGIDPTNFCFRKDGRAIAFMAGGSLWLYMYGMDKSIEKVSPNTTGVPANMLLAPSQPQFSPDGKRLFFYLQHKQGQHLSDSSRLKIFSYADPELSDETTEHLASKYTATISLIEDRVVQICGDNERDFGSVNDYSLVEHCIDLNMAEANWNKAAAADFYLVSCKNGSRKTVVKGLSAAAGTVFLSPTGKWAVYYDPVRRNYFSYEVNSGIIRNMTRGARTNWTATNNPYPASDIYGIAAWLKNDQTAIIYDNNDIWLVDPRGEKPPVNFTNYYGKKNNIRFLLTQDSPVSGMILLTAFNNGTKENGFFKKSMYASGDPILLCMNSYVYDWQTSNTNFPFNPVKATNASVYLIKRQSATEAPNYFLTLDFSRFVQLTNVQPQKPYNWLKTELISFSTIDGKPSRGILYKPEDFDPKKKYPVIFNFYEEMSDRLNEYLFPAAMSGPVDIPWLVSHGYLVFTPDIQYTIGSAGESAYNTVVAAAHAVGRLPFADSARFGIQGHSFGGFEVNYIVTHTGLFKAAAEAAGPSDDISSYLLVSHGGHSRFWLYELNQCRMGATLWQRPELYLNDSPDLNAARITTPLLIMHNQADRQVPWSEGLKLFDACRRLGKKAWMLSYRKGGHNLDNEQDAQDYTVRLMQFFDHYLKGAPAPDWLYTGPSLLTPDEQLKVDSIKHHKPLKFMISP